MSKRFAVPANSAIGLDFCINKNDTNEKNKIIIPNNNTPPPIVLIGAPSSLGDGFLNSITSPIIIIIAEKNTPAPRPIYDMALPTDAVVLYAPDSNDDI